MPLVRFPTPTGLVYTIDLSKIADRENPRTVEAPIAGAYPAEVIVDWGDGTPPQTLNTADGDYPAHTYADGTGDVFTVTIRNATARFPIIRANNVGTFNTLPTNNISYAITDIQHFAGEMGVYATASYPAAFCNCYNLKYADPRMIGYYKWTTIANVFRNNAALTGASSQLANPAESFCFDFGVNLTNMTFVFVSCASITGTPQGRWFANKPGLANVQYIFAGAGITSINAELFQGVETSVNIGGAFNDCDSLTALPAGLFDNCPWITSVNALFDDCGNLDGEPYRFWKEDGTTDTARFPNMGNTASCYRGCAATLRAKVPTDYGGTMSVS